MKTYLLSALAGLSILAFSVFSSCTTEPSVEKDCRLSFRAFVEEQELHFADEQVSPLMEEDFNRFESLNYYPFDANYCLTATLKRMPGEEPFEMQTSTERKPVYQKYGELHFALGGLNLVLAVYQNLRLMEDDEFKNYLFLPFNDLSNGETTYGGGRYIDLEIPDSESVVLDFNSSYHPYCAYNYEYSCPIPPEENVLDIAIEAGVRSGINGEAPEGKH